VLLKVGQCHFFQLLELFLIILMLVAVEKPEAALLLKQALALLVVLAPLAFVAIAELAPGLSPLWEGLALARFGVTTLALLAALVIAQKWLPAGRRSFRQIWPGVIFTLALSFVFAFAFGRYLEQFARTYVTTYAGLASVMIALLFLYALASIFVYGGELNAAIHRAQTTKAD
jgi:membrane protein